MSQVPQLLRWNPCVFHEQWQYCATQELGRQLRRPTTEAQKHKLRELASAGWEEPMLPWVPLQHNRSTAIVRTPNAGHETVAFAVAARHHLAHLSAGSPPDHAVVEGISHQHRTVPLHGNTFRPSRQLVETVAAPVAARDYLGDLY